MPGKGDSKDLLDDWELFFFLGVAGFFFAAFGLFPTFAVGWGDDAPLGNLFLIACVPIPLIAGIVCLAIGLRGRKRYRQLVELADMLKAYRRIKVADLAHKMQLSEFEVEKKVSKCVAYELVEGYFDRQTGEFFTLEALGQELDITECPECGADFDKIHLVGEHLKCGYCNNVISTVSRKPEEKGQSDGH